MVLGSDSDSGGSIELIGILELSMFQATIIAIALPIVTICIFILIIPWLSNGSGSRLRRYLSYLVSPPRIGSLLSEESGNDANRRNAKLWRGLKVRLFFLYLAIALFLISFILSEFYEVMLDVFLPVTQGSTGDMRIVTSIVFQSPFNAGWIGAMPWYGSLPAPSNLGIYHETWNWIFFTAAITDNPYFLETTITALLLLSLGVGSVFLAPLASKTIRHSFIPSIFFLISGMAIFTKTVFASFAHAWALIFGNASFQYGIISITGEMIPNLIDAIIYGIPILLGMFALFIVLGWKLWGVHYADVESRRWFIAYIAMSYWIGLALSILVV